jgi:CelD/BcsL family acetyltransferase involved in cellulose biosynthesis
MHKREIDQEYPPMEALPVERVSPAVPVTFAALQIDVITDPYAVEPDWRRLEQFNRNSLHQSFDWCMAWTRVHRSELAIVRGSVDGQTFFLLPLEIMLEHGMRIAGFPGGRFNNLNTGLFDPTIALPDAEELQNFTYAVTQGLKAKADLIALDNVPLVWRGGRHPLSGLASIENQNHSFQLPLFANFEVTLAQLNAKSRRKKFRSQSRKLEAIGGYDHVIAGEDEKHRLLDLFFRQKGERLTMFGLPNVFHAAETHDFFHHLLDVPRNGSEYPLEVQAIRLRGIHDGHIAAIAGLSRKGDHVICQFSSIDESICPEASPGELLFWLMIEASCRQGASIFDFGVGDQPYKRNWCAQETVQHDLLIPLTFKGALAQPMLVAVTKAKTFIKRNPHLYALVQRWRSGKCQKQADAVTTSAED